jgi:hypothetical protein
MLRGFPHFSHFPHPNLELATAGMTLTRVVAAMTRDGECRGQHPARHNASARCSDAQLALALIVLGSEGVR